MRERQSISSIEPSVKTMRPTGATAAAGRRGSIARNKVTLEY